MNTGDTPTGNDAIRHILAISRDALDRASREEDPVARDLMLEVALVECRDFSYTTLEHLEGEDFRVFRRDSRAVPRTRDEASRRALNTAGYYHMEDDAHIYGRQSRLMPVLCVVALIWVAIVQIGFGWPL